jgi:hypothetical protein
VSVLPRLTRVITGYAVQLLCRKTQNVRRKAIRNNQLIGKETERGWEKSEDISTLLPSLMQYQLNTGTAQQSLRQRLQQISLDVLQKETSLSRHTILRARRGERVHLRSLKRLRIAAATVPVRES